MRAALATVAVVVALVPSGAGAALAETCRVSVGPATLRVDRANRITGLVNYRVHGSTERKVTVVADLRRGGALEYRDQGPVLGAPGWAHAGTVQQAPLTWRGETVELRIEVRACGSSTVRRATVTTNNRPRP